MNEENRPAWATAKPTTASPAGATACPPRGSEAKPQPKRAGADKRTVRFELEVAKARSVYLVGTFNNWSATSTALVCVGGTTWSRDLLLPPGRYEYRFVVDGKWVEPPHAKAYTPNPSGGRNGVFDR